MSICLIVSDEVSDDSWKTSIPKYNFLSSAIVTSLPEISSVSVPSSSYSSEISFPVPKYNFLSSAMFKSPH